MSQHTKIPGDVAQPADDARPVGAPALRDVEEFRSLVNTLMHEARITREPQFFRNRGTAFARVVLDTMIDNAEEEICIFAREVSSEIYDLAKIRAFLARSEGNIVRIVVEMPEAPMAATSILSQLADEIDKGHVTLRINTQAPKNSNLCVVDRIHTRFETDQVSRQAKVMFGDEKTGETACRRFVEFESKGTAYPPPA